MKCQIQENKGLVLQISKFNKYKYSLLRKKKKETKTPTENDCKQFYSTTLKVEYDLKLKFLLLFFL